MVLRILRGWLSIEISVARFPCANLLTDLLVSGVAGRFKT